MKTQLLDRPEISGMADQLWRMLVEFVETDIEADDSILITRLTDLLVDVSSNLKGETKLRGDINDGMVSALSTFVDAQKHNLSKFVAEQVKSWDFAQLTLLIEANIGKDLQYIRFNGMIIGGMAGVVLFLIEKLILGV
jgi:uncharacterized membrane-anchored protein YjiN (DUF445 family)